MTNYKEKYFYTFKDINDKYTYRVEIWEDTTTPLIPIEIRGYSNPCTIKYNSDYIFEPVRGSGCELALLSTSNQMFNNLYTSDMMNYVVKVYKNNSLYWTGFLDSENYSEPFDTLTNYEVNITCNDGFNLLSRMNYINENYGVYTNITGIESQWTVLLRCFNKLNLDWNYIQIGLTSTIPNVTINDDETIFHKLYINNDNFYNEDYEPESYRTVLESILKPYGAFIIQVDGNILITDSNYIASAAFALGYFKQYIYKYEYQPNSFATVYDSTILITLNLGDITDIGVQSSKQQFEIESGINKQVVVYSPYAVTDYFKFEMEDDFTTTDAVVSNTHQYYGSDETSFLNSKIWNKYNKGKFCKIQGTGENNSDKSDTYLKIEAYNKLNSTTVYQSNTATDFCFIDEARKSFSIKGKLNHILPSDYQIKLEMTIHPQTNAMYGESGAVIPENATLNEVRLNCMIKIKDDSTGVEKKFVNTADANRIDYTSYWNNLGDAGNAILNFTKPYKVESPVRVFLNTLNDTDVELKRNTLTSNDANGKIVESDFYIPLNYGQRNNTKVTGCISIDIYDYAFQSAESNPTYWHFSQRPTIPMSLWIKDIALIIVDNKGNEVEKIDVEYTSKLDANYSNEGKEVKNYLGTNTTNYPVERGNLLLKSDTNIYSYLKNTTKAGTTDLIENLLLRTIKANYLTPNIKLTVDLPAINAVGYYTYFNYLPDKKLMILSNSIDLAENISSLTLREIHNDNEVTIN